MNQLKKLIIPLAVMLVLVIGVIIYFVVSSGSSPEEQEFNKDVFYKSTYDISQLTVHRKDNPDDIVIGVSKNDAGSVVYTFNNQLVDDSNYSINAVSEYIGILANYSVNSLVTDNGNLSEYGLDDPEAVITITGIDGSVTVIKIGDDTYEGANCYMCIDGSPNVYTVALMKKVYANHNEIDFLQSQVLNIDYSRISTVQFDRNEDNVHLKASCEIYEETGEPVYYVFDPYQIKASAYFENLMEYICTLEITQFMDIPSDQLASYGLDDPAFHFLITMDNGEKTEIYLSGKLAGFYYGRIVGVNDYFMISDMQIKGLETPLLTLLSSYITYYTSDELSSVTCVYEGETYRFTLEVENGAKLADSDVRLNNRNAIIYNSEGRHYASVLFETLATITIGGIDLEGNPDVSDSIMTLTYITNDHKTIKVDFVPRTDNTYYVMINDTNSFFYVSSNELFLDGGADTYNYGVWPAFTLLDTAIRDNVNGIYDIPGTTGEA
ncbi:MAG: DUF4340 domain-containing protein [Clostridiales bacterium]|nr:DUF4340 domain-containing protein [Clostridiales bacterium]